MSYPSREYPEAFSSRPGAAAWGCVAPINGWVPFPPKIPRRHPLIDAVGRVEDPCDHPKYEAPDWNPRPSFNAPREGYPHDICQMPETARNARNEGQPGPEIVQGAAAVIDVGRDTAQHIHVRLPPISNEECPGEEPTVADCCNDTRALDAVEEKYREVVGPFEELDAGMPKHFLKKQSPCQPLLKKYPCRGVIDEMPEGLYRPTTLEERCRSKSLENPPNMENWDKQKSVDGWEFIDKCRTCDYYPIQQGLAKRFNYPAWFKGYGCEKPLHPFYVTTTSDYGRFGPNPHTMTQMYYPRNAEFTALLGATGMYRNRTLNTSSNKSIV